ncbi:MAG TPA: HAD-IA family hydrolase, partial [Blastocatellia bacterium]|nr:HAD-IA family hydrolase [Blastocatellia bacterium]
DDAENSKPDPDIVKAALDSSGCAPDEVLMIGDTPYDIESASRAGIGVIAFRCGGWKDADLSGAVAIYDGPADLLSRYESSPVGKSG